MQGKSTDLVLANALRWWSSLLKPNSITLSWSQTGPRLVADLSQTC